jgi:TM2 domain-containing membrane protein YozV
MEQHIHHYHYAPAVTQKSGGVAAILEVLPGIFLWTFGIGHMYAGNVAVGLLIMIGFWLAMAVNIALCFVLIGFITLPITWLTVLIASPLIAASACSSR